MEPTNDNAIFRIKQLARRIPLGLIAYRAIRLWFDRCILHVAPVAYAKIRYRRIMKRRINLAKPETYSEKMVWLMHYWKHPLKTRCADKFAVRSYVAEKGCADVLVPLLGDYDDPSEIDFDVLPSRFALKCSHGCGYNIICKDKSTLDIAEAKRKLSQWMKQDYSRFAGEPHYHGMTPKIICEPFLDDLAGELPIDYKLYCIGGKVFCVSYLKGRTIGGHSIVETMYDRDWKLQSWLLKEAVKRENVVPPPPGYERMVEVAEILSKPFPFVRVDFYSVGGKAMLGEMTFTSAGGISAAWTDEAQKIMGNLIDLPEKYLPNGR